MKKHDNIDSTLWTPIQGFPNYEVSTGGHVRSVKHNRLMTPQSNHKGYYKVGLKSETTGRVQKKFIHRLVAEAFLPNPDKLPQVNHKNCDKTDNRVENLEWVDGSYNMRHMVANGRSTIAKLNVVTASEIRELLLLGAAVKKLARKYGVSPKTIRDIRDGKVWSWVYEASRYLPNP